MKRTVSQKGQVAIPKPLRERLGIRPGNVLDFSEEQGRLVATKVTAQDPVESVYGDITIKTGIHEAPNFQDVGSYRKPYMEVWIPIADNQWTPRHLPSA